MSIGKKIFATITVDESGKPVIDVGDRRYTIITLEDGTVCIVEKASKEYIAID
jgi:hypothetical protein